LWVIGKGVLEWGVDTMGYVLFVLFLRRGRRVKEERRGEMRVACS
jgi:hypothetical protein